jgi:hypothetical protein
MVAGGGGRATRYLSGFRLNTGARRGVPNSSRPATPQQDDGPTAVYSRTVARTSTPQRNGQLSGTVSEAHHGGSGRYQHHHQHQCPWPWPCPCCHDVDGMLLGEGE